ncbi:hypothetical protein EGW08_007068 [Elysia chlorotica]|uniref:CABIT domain-containing protein n=1 Tax=Elysia chlorotica TaxID=188477 RepID=A0A3S0ZX21_ELYCH|nr:hypothetical protein EGW08_007068 [Elysia chlorotica]
MAASGIPVSHSETTTSSSSVFADFVKTCEFPSYVIVTSGRYSYKNVQVSEGDVLMLKSLDRRKVTLTYLNSDEQYTEVRAPLGSKRNFFVLSPKGKTDSDAKCSTEIMYPTISDLLIDCPTYFEATASYDDPYLPQLSIRAGDRFRFVKRKATKRGDSHLETTDDKGNTIILTSSCQGNFCPVSDPKQYSLQDLVDLAPVQRRLMPVALEKPSDAEKSPEMVCQKADRSHLSLGHIKSDTFSKQKPPVAGSLSNNSRVSRASDHEKLSEVTSTSEDTDDSNRINSIPTSTVLHMQPIVIASLYKDSGIALEIPVSASLRVELYNPSDYEVPRVNKLAKSPLDVHLPLPPLSPSEDVPKYPAPSAPPLPQPLVPLNINSFADIYTGSLPAKAKVLDISKCDQFWQKVLENTYDLNVFRVEEENRLYVRDSKSEDVYSLSQDLDISFLEYPEKLSGVSELLHLPIGTELTILEDIASDYPNPISLRFGDIIRICTNTTQLVKLKFGHRDCEVLKVEKYDPGGVEPTKLKLPTDFEVRMSMSNNSGNLKPISLSKILWSSSRIPSKVVAILPGEDENQKHLLRNLPSDVLVLRAMKQSVLVVASSHEIDGHSQGFVSKASSTSRNGLKNASGLSRGEIADSMGLPLSCGAILAFQGRLGIPDVDLSQYPADFKRIPVEKITMSEFEEREQLRKLNSDYEDISTGKDQASLCADECGTQASNLHRTLSVGAIERHEKRSRIDKVRRLSRALNPKHWRHSRHEPEPLPHPSAMGLMALAARPPSGYQNDYHHEQSDNANSIHSGSTNTEASTDDASEEENFYEDVEIGPIKSATMESKSSDVDKGKSGFAGFLYKSLPSPRRNRRQRVINKTAPWDKTGEDEDGVTNIANGASADVATGRESHSSSVPKSHSLDKALRWASKLGDKIHGSSEPLAFGRTREGKDGNKVFHMANKKGHKSSTLGYFSDIAVASSPPSDRAPSPPIAPPPRNASLGLTKDIQRPIQVNEDARHSEAPVAPARRKRAPPKTLETSENSSLLMVKPSNDSTATLTFPTAPSRGGSPLTSDENGANNPKIQPLPRKSLWHTEKKLENPSLEDKTSSFNPEAPKPKPRGASIHSSLETISSECDATQAMEALKFEKTSSGKMKEEEHSTNKHARVPPPIKPRMM